MPTKKSLPSTDIAVWLSYSLDFLSQGVPQQGVETVEVPRLGGVVHEGGSEVCAVDRG